MNVGMSSQAKHLREPQLDKKLAQAVIEEKKDEDEKDRKPAPRPVENKQSPVSQFHLLDVKI